LGVKRGESKDETIIAPRENISPFLIKTLGLCPEGTKSRWSGILMPGIARKLVRPFADLVRGRSSGELKDTMIIGFRHQVRIGFSKALEHVFDDKRRVINDALHKSFV
jgi:hypothetical protein